MTLPDNNDLKQLLAQATPGPWYYDEESDGIYGAIRIDNGLLTQPLVDLYSGSDVDLAIRAPELAAEVIRLREGIQSRIDHHFAAAKEKLDTDECDPLEMLQDTHLASVYRLKLILEGDLQ